MESHNYRNYASFVQFARHLYLGVHQIKEVQVRSHSSRLTARWSSNIQAKTSNLWLEKRTSAQNACFQIPYPLYQSKHSNDSSDFFWKADFIENVFSSRDGENTFHGMKNIQCLRLSRLECCNSLARHWTWNLQKVGCCPPYHQRNTWGKKNSAFIRLYIDFFFHHPGFCVQAAKMGNPGERLRLKGLKNSSALSPRIWSFSKCAHFGAWNLLRLVAIAGALEAKKLSPSSF